jgi:hypothetical protein
MCCRDTSSRSDHATSEEFPKLFTEDVNSLYLLSFLLTTNRQEAERCFVPGLADCVDGNSIFKEWASAWARHIIVRNATRIVGPHVRPAAPAASPSHLANEDNFPTIPLHDAPFANVLALEDFERFVYVLCVLERYPDESCAVLLGTSTEEIQKTRIRALQHIAESNEARRKCDLETRDQT